MTIQQMFKSWGVVFPEGNNEYLYLPEYLLQKYPAKCYFADFFQNQFQKAMHTNTRKSKVKYMI